MRRFLIIVLALLMAAAAAWAEEAAEIIPADEITLAAFGDDMALELRFTNVRLLAEHPAGDGTEAGEGNAWLVLDFKVTNFDFADAELPGQVTAAADYSGALTYEAAATFASDTIGMLIETSGQFVFCVPGAVAADAENPLVLTVNVDGTSGQVYVDVSAEAAALGYAPAERESGLTVAKTADRILRSFGGQTADAFRWIAADLELRNNGTETVTVADVLDAKLSYRGRFEYEAVMQAARPELAPMEYETVTLAFRVPYMVAADEEDLPLLTVTVAGVPQQIPLDLSASRTQVHAYAYIPGAVTWEEARAACEAMNGHLATLTSEQENEFVKGLFEERDYPWLGGYADEERNWYWITGEPFEFTAWTRGQPDAGGEDKLNMFTGKGWNDADNTARYISGGVKGYLCEWDDPALCAYEGARTLLVSDPADLLQAPAFDYDDLTGKEGLQAGLEYTTVYQDLREDENYRYVRVRLNVINRGEETAPLTDAAAATLSYRGRYTFDAQTVYSSATLEPLEIGTVDLIFSIPAVVLRGTDEEIVLNLTVNGEETDVGFRMSEAVQGVHAYALIRGHLDWVDAKDACERMGGHLVTITSEEENTFVLTLYEEQDYPWFGGYKDSNIHWNWVTGEPFDYMHFVYTDYGRDLSEPYLGAWRSKDWNDYRGNTSTVQSYICEWEDPFLVPADVSAQTFRN